MLTGNVTTLNDNTASTGETLQCVPLYCYAHLGATVILHGHVTTVKYVQLCTSSRIATLASCGEGER